MQTILRFGIGSGVIEFCKSFRFALLVPLMPYHPLVDSFFLLYFLSA